MNKKYYEELPEGYELAEVVEFDEAKNKKVSFKQIILMSLSTIIIYLIRVIWIPIESSEPVGILNAMLYGMLIGIMIALVFLILYYLMSYLFFKLIINPKIKIKIIKKIVVFSFPNAYMKKRPYLISKITPSILFALLTLILVFIINGQYFVLSLLVINAINIFVIDITMYNNKSFLKYGQDALVLDEGLSQKIYIKKNL